MKKLVAISFAAVLSGCATQADIQMPTVSQVYHEAFVDKSMSYEIMYSQPKPGVFTGGEQMPMVPLAEAETSVASAATLKNLPDYIFDQLPSSMTRAEPGKEDLKLIVELTAYDKKGPAYADYEAAKSMGKGLLTLGLGASEYNIVADFDAKYSLYDHGEEVFSKSYKVNEEVDHERSQFGGFSSLNDFAGQLLEKHLIITLNDFFKESSEAF